MKKNTGSGKPTPGGNAALFLRILALQSKIGKSGGAEVFSILDCPVSKNSGTLSPEKIEKSVNRAVRFGEIFGGLNSCLSRSVIRCRLMRENGIDARVVFGLRRGEKTLTGHSWVVWPDGPAHKPDHTQFDSLEIHPPPDRVPGWTPFF